MTSPDSANPATASSTTDRAKFDYERAFSRNVGWISTNERDVIRRSRVAVAGLGGVGGAHVLTLARLGIGAFNVADFDHFELHNFNRQAGAFVSTIGASKVDVIQRMARDINPQADVRAFSSGVTPDAVREFLDGADLYIDGLDFFAIEIRRRVFQCCTELGIPAVTAAPLGMGAAMLYFKPGGMTFERYFRLENADRNEQLVRFLAGLSPTMPHRTYLRDPGAVDLAAGRVPSTVMGCELSAGMAATAALQILLRRGEPRPAPWAVHFDAYRRTLRKTWRPFGNWNPVQRLLMRFIRQALRNPTAEAGGVGRDGA